MTKSSGGDLCKEDVFYTYFELCKKGAPDSVAFRAAISIYRAQHPEVGAREAKYATTDLISEGLGLGQAQPGPRRGAP